MSRNRRIVALLLLALGPALATACTDPSGPRPTPSYEQQGSETK
jgi:hypothetical protein